MSHFLFAPLGSGSSGNAYLLKVGRDAVLIDCGLSCRRVTNSLTELGVHPEDVLGVLITHDHSDHTSGLPLVHQPPRMGHLWYRQTLENIRWKLGSGGITHSLPKNLRLDLDPSRSKPRDPARYPDPVGYRIAIGDFRLAVCTDLGHASARAKEMLAGLDLMVLESNHDLGMLETDPIPPG